MKKAVIRILAAVLALALASGWPCALAEGGEWTCENCGRTGNTGNFCSNCGAENRTEAGRAASAGRPGTPGISAATAEPRNRKEAGPRPPLR